MSILAIVAAAVVKFLLGWLWYSPVLFLKPYLAGVGITREEMNASMGKALAVDFVLNLVLAAALAWLLARAGASTVASAVLVAVVGWIAFTFTVSAASIGYERRPASLVAISAGFHLVGAIAMAAVLVLMR